MPAGRIERGDTGIDEPLLPAMPGLEVLRLDPFDRDNAHRGPGDACIHRFGIAGLALRRLDIRGDALRRDQPSVIFMFTATSSPIVGAPTGVHADAHRRANRP
jgi:hypothetical protein